MGAGSPGLVTQSVTVTVTVAGAQADRYVSLYHVGNSNTVKLHLQCTCLLTLRGDNSQRKHGESEELVAEHVDSGNLIGSGDEAQ